MLRVQRAQVREHRGVPCFLVELIGEERVLALESNNEKHRYTREELDGIRAKAVADLRALKQQEAA